MPYIMLIFNNINVYFLDYVLYVMKQPHENKGNL
jgi:hypothetical protein